MVGRDPRVTVRLPPKLLGLLEKEVEERNIEWENRGDILIDALSKHYIDMDPEKRKAEILQAFREDPAALRELGQMILSLTLDK